MAVGNHVTAALFAMPCTVMFTSHNELYLVDCENVLYMQADDHYTHVYYLSGAHFLMPFGLAEVTETVYNALKDDRFLVRLSRKYLVNIRAVFHINTVKQVLVLADAHGNNISIHLPKQTLRELIQSLAE